MWGYDVLCYEYSLLSLGSIKATQDWLSMHAILSLNLIGCITVDKRSKLPFVYKMGKEKNTAKRFMEFIRQLIYNRWFNHLDVLVLDNAAVHVGDEAAFLGDLLWNFEVDGKPLHVMVIYLPTRSPELNPIEFLFNTLSLRIRQYRRNTTRSPVAKPVIHYGSWVMDNFSYDDVARAYGKAGYYTDYLY